MQAFRLSKGWRITSYAFCVLFIGIALFLLFLATSGEVKTAASIAYHAVAILFLFLTWYVYRDTTNGKLHLGEENITHVSPFRSVVLPLDEVRGFRLTDHYIILEPGRKGQRKIRISVYLERQHELQEWLYERFPNLDEAENQQEVEEILNNDDLGLFHETRIRKWAESRQVARWTNRVTWGVSLWLIFYPKPYPVVVVTGILIPLVAVGLAYFYRGLMKGGDRKSSAYPSVAEAFVVPGMAILLRALFDFEILFYENAWAPVATLTVTLFFVYHFPTGGFSPKKWADYLFLAVFPIFTFAYSLGTIMIMNCAFDHSKPATYETRVISKHFTKGKTTTYYLTVEPWKGLENPEDIEVERNDYERAGISDTVKIFQYPGLLNIPWIKAALVTPPKVRSS